MKRRLQLVIRQEQRRGSSTCHHSAVDRRLQEG
jgi:hypothetical protein